MTFRHGMKEVQWWYREALHSVASIRHERNCGRDSLMIKGGDMQLRRCIQALETVHRILAWVWSMPFVPLSAIDKGGESTKQNRPPRSPFGGGVHCRSSSFVVMPDVIVLECHGQSSVLDQRLISNLYVRLPDNVIKQSQRCVVAVLYP